MNDDFFQDNDGFLTNPTIYTTQSKVLKKRKRKKYPIFIIGGIIIIVAVIAATAFFLTRNKLDYSRAEELTKKIIDMTKQSDISSIDGYIDPYIRDYYSKTDGIELYIFYEIKSCFLTPGYDFLDYSIKPAKQWDSERYYSRAKGLLDVYVNPTDFVQVEVEISYNEQKSSIYFNYIYYDKTFYLFEVDNDDYDIVFSDYTFQNTIPSKELNDAFKNHTVTIDGEATGERTDLGDFSIVLPSGWTSTKNVSSLLEMRNFDVLYLEEWPDLSDNLLTSQNKMTKIFIDKRNGIDWLYYDILLPSALNKSDLVITDAGIIKTDYLAGFYIDLYHLEQDHPNSPLHVTYVIYPSETYTYILNIAQHDNIYNSLEDVLKLAASFKLE